MKRKVTCFTSMALAVLMAVSPVAGSSVSVFAAEPSDDITAIQVTPNEEDSSDDKIVVETNSDAIEAEKEMQASVKVGDAGESDIVVETEYLAGDAVPVHVTAENPTDKAADFRLYFWDYGESLPEDKGEWSEVLTDACEDVKIAELQDADEYAVDLKQGEDNVQSKASFVSDKDDKDHLTAAYLSMEIPAGAAMDTVFHISSDAAETVTVVPAFDTESENAFYGDAAVAQWKENPIVVEAGETEDSSESEPDTEDTDEIVVETEEPADSFLSIYVGDSSAGEEEEATETEEPVAEEEAGSEKSDTEAEPETDTDSEISVEAESEEEDSVATISDAADLNASDFASMRLVVLADDASVIANDSDVIGQYEDVYLLQFTSIQQAMNAYVYYKDKVQAVEPDAVVETASEPESDVVAENMPDIQMDEKENPIAALSELETSEDVQNEHGVIALIDTGVSESDNVIDRVSVIDDALEGNGHGNAMLKAIVSQDTEAKILSIRVMDDSGFGTVSSLVAAMEYAIEQKVDIINLSLYAKATLSTSVLKQEILKAVNEGIPVVGAAGNNNADAVGYMPGAVEEAYIIGAANEDGSRLEISNYGATVDYNVVADSTSEATALFTGFVSANGLDAVEDALNQGMIYAVDYALVGLDDSSDDAGQPVSGDSEEPEEPDETNSDESGEDYDKAAFIKDYKESDEKAQKILDESWDLGYSENYLMGIAPAYVGETIWSKGFSSELGERGQIDVIRYNDPDYWQDYDVLNNWSEGVLGARDSGEWMFCSDPKQHFKGGWKTSVDARNYYSEDTVTLIAGLLYYADNYGCSGLSDIDDYYIKQCFVWRVLNEINHWYTGGDRIAFEYGNGAQDSQGHWVADHYADMWWGGTEWVTANKDYLTCSGEIFEGEGQPISRWTCTYNPIEYTDITVSKSWSDYNNESGARPGSVQVSLYQSTSSNVNTSVSPYDTVTLDESNNWSYTWEDLVHKDGNTTYYYAVKETSVPTYYTATYSQPGSGTSATVTNTIQEAYLRLHKDSALPDISDNNNCYSLEGAEYTVYTTRSGNALSGAVGVLKTDENGDSNALRLLPKTYYVKETKAPKGFEPNPQIYTVELTTGNTTSKPYVLNVEDVPGNDPTGIEIDKIYNGPDTDTVKKMPLTGTQFTIKYYDGYYNTENELKGKIPLRTWVLEVKEINGRYMAMLTDSYLVSGELYRDGAGQPCLPLGTITIQETKAAPGYTLDGYLKDKNGNVIATDSELYVAKITEDSGAVALQGGNEFKGENTPTPNTIKLKKFDSDGKTPLAGVTFEIRNSDGDLVEETKTNSKGEIVFDDLYPDVYTIKETATVDGHTLLKDPIVIEVPMMLTDKEVKDYGIDTKDESVVYNEANKTWYIHEFTFEVTNNVTFKMPMSGGFATPMTFVPLIAGMGILGGLGVVGFRKKRKK